MEGNGKPGTPNGLVLNEDGDGEGVEEGEHALLIVLVLPAEVLLILDDRAARRRLARHRRDPRPAAAAQPRDAGLNRRTRTGAQAIAP